MSQYISSYKVTIPATVEYKKIMELKPTTNEEIHIEGIAGKVSAKGAIIGQLGMEKIWKISREMPINVDHYFPVDVVLGFGDRLFAYVWHEPDQAITGWFWIKYKKVSV